MRDISIIDIANLVVSDVADPDKRLEKMFDWHFTREMEIAKWVLGLSATIAAAFLVAGFKSELHPNWWQATLLALIPLATAGVGLFRLNRARSIQRQYLSALRIHAELHRVRPFLIRYREAKRV